MVVAGLMAMGISLADSRIEGGKRETFAGLSLGSVRYRVAISVVRYRMGRPYVIDKFLTYITL